LLKAVVQCNLAICWLDWPKLELELELKLAPHKTGHGMPVSAFGRNPWQTAWWESNPCHLVQKSQLVPSAYSQLPSTPRQQRGDQRQRRYKRHSCEYWTRIL